MDAMVIKYLLLTVVAYGLHTFLAIAQILLALFMIFCGVIHLKNKVHLGAWASRFGLLLNEQIGQNTVNSWLMVLTGVFLLLPLLGLSYWFGAIGCAAAVYWIIALANSGEKDGQKTTGNIARKGLIVSAVLVFGFTLWEGRDLVRAAWDVNYKVVYWRNLEVGWQNENNPNAPKAGDMAPDFELTDVHGNESVRLSDFKGKRPVVLLFGSFT